VTSVALLGLPQPRLFNIPQIQLNNEEGGDVVPGDRVTTSDPPAVHHYDSDSAKRLDFRSQPRSAHSDFIPPPPPPPPLSSNSIYVPPPYVTPSRNIPDLAPTTRDASVDRLDREQEELRDFRGKVLGSRYRVAAKRIDLRDLHIEASAKDGSVFNLVRQYLHTINLQLPRNIEEALSDASTLRDQLGLLEAEYDEAEASYNTLEWNYSRRETRFVEEVLNNRLVPSGMLDRSRSAENLDIAQLTQFMTPSMAKPLPAWNHTAYADEVESGDAIQAPIELGQQDLELSDEALSKLQRADSQRSSHGFAPATRRESKSSFRQAQLQSRWINKKRGIDAWRMEIFENFPVLRVYLKAMYDLDCPDDNLWWEHIKQLLVQGNEVAPVFHTGDSTVSLQTSRHASTSTVNIASPDACAVRDFSTIPQLPEDHASNMPGTGDIPSSIGPRDHVDTHDEVQDSAKPSLSTIDETTDSYTASQTLSRRTSCSEAVNTESDATSHYSSDCDNCTNRVESLHAPTPSMESSTTSDGKPQGNEGAPVTPTQRSQNEANLITPDPQIDLYSTPWGEAAAQAEKQATAGSIELARSSEQDSPLHKSNVGSPEIPPNRTERSEEPPRPQVVLSTSHGNAFEQPSSSPRPYIISSRNSSLPTARSNDKRCLVM
jgi:hypothetical protein